VAVVSERGSIPYLTDRVGAGDATALAPGAVGVGVAALLGEVSETRLVIAVGFAVGRAAGCRRHRAGEPIRQVVAEYLRGGRACCVVAAGAREEVAQLVETVRPVLNQVVVVRVRRRLR